jgi:hypothetical protein
LALAPTVSECAEVEHFAARVLARKLQNIVGRRVALAAQSDAVASAVKMLVGAAKQVSAEATGHQRFRIVIKVQQRWIGRAGRCL